MQQVTGRLQPQRPPVIALPKRCQPSRGQWRGGIALGSAVFGAIMLASSARASPCPTPDNVTRVTGGTECLIAKTYQRGTGRDNASLLFVLLHGNHTSGSPATSMFAPAAVLADRSSADAVAVALVRPGYNDNTGQRSSGSDGGRADNFTADNVDHVAGAVATLKAFHRARRVVLIGHSGGAAMAGVMLGRHPGLADAALLVSCPCDVSAWRSISRSSGRPWLSESPHRYVDRIPLRTRIAVLVGSEDTVTPPFLSQDYAALLGARGIAVRLLIPAGINHANVLNAPELVDEALRLGASE